MIFWNRNHHEMDVQSQLDDAKTEARYGKFHLATKLFLKILHSTDFMEKCPEKWKETFFGLCLLDILTGKLIPCSEEEDSLMTLTNFSPKFLFLKKILQSKDSYTFTHVIREHQSLFMADSFQVSMLLRIKCDRFEEKEENCDLSQCELQLEQFFDEKRKEEEEQQLAHHLDVDESFRKMVNQKAKEMFLC